MTYVYFISTKRQNVVKIGVANKPSKRLKTFQTAHYEELIILKVIKVKSRALAFKIESALHKKFKRYHIRGEWFKLTPTISDFIEKSYSEETSIVEELIDYLESLILLLVILLFGFILIENFFHISL